MAAFFEFVGMESSSQKFAELVTLEFKYVGIERGKLFIETMDLSNIKPSNIKVKEIEFIHPFESSTITVATNSKIPVINKEYGDNVEDLVIKIKYDYFFKEYSAFLNISNTNFTG